jgi:hypothetical protein
MSVLLRTIHKGGGGGSLTLFPSIAKINKKTISQKSGLGSAPITWGHLAVGELFVGELVARELVIITMFGENGRI